MSSSRRLQHRLSSDSVEVSTHETPVRNYKINKRGRMIVEVVNTKREQMPEVPEDLPQIIVETPEPTEYLESPESPPSSPSPKRSRMSIPQIPLEPVVYSLEDRRRRDANFDAYYGFGWVTNDEPTRAAWQSYIERGPGPAEIHDRKECIDEFWLRPRSRSTSRSPSPRPEPTFESLYPEKEEEKDETADTDVESVASWESDSQSIVEVSSDEELN